MSEQVDILVRVKDEASAQLRAIEAALTSLRRQAAQGLPAAIAPPRVSMPPVVQPPSARFPVSTVLPQMPQIAPSLTKAETATVALTRSTVATAQASTAAVRAFEAESQAATRLATSLKQTAAVPPPRQAATPFVQLPFQRPPGRQYPAAPVPQMPVLQIPRPSTAIAPALRQITQAQQQLTQSTTRAVQAMLRQAQAGQSLVQSSLRVTTALAAQAVAATKIATSSAGGLGSGLAAIPTLASQASGALGALASVAVGVSASIGAAAIAVGTYAVTVGMRMESLRTTMDTVGGGMRQGAESMAFVRATATRLGLDMEALAQQYVRLQAASQGTTLAGKQTQDVFTAVATASRVLGLTTEETRGALNAIQQMMSKGTVASEELRGQLGERLPGAFQIAARAMGVTTAQLGKMLEQGQVLATDLLPKLGAQLMKELGGGAERASQTAAAALARFKNALVAIGVAISASGVLEAFNRIIKDMTWILDKSQAVLNALSSIDKAQQEMGARAQGLEMPIHREAFLKLSADIDGTNAKINHLTVTMGALARQANHATGEMQAQFEARRAALEPELAKQRERLQGLEKEREALRKLIDTSAQRVAAQREADPFEGEIQDAAARQASREAEAKKREEAVVRYVAMVKQQEQALADFVQRIRLVTGKDPTIAEREVEVKRLRKDLDELITTDLKELQAAKAGDVRLKTLQDFGKIRPAAILAEISTKLTADLIAVNDQAQLLGPRFDVITERVKLTEKAAEAYAIGLGEAQRAGEEMTQEQSQAFGSILAQLDAAKAAEKARDEAQKATDKARQDREQKATQLLADQQRFRDELQEQEDKLVLTLDQQIEKRAQLLGLGAAEVQQRVQQAQHLRALEAVRQVQEEINALLLAAGKTQEELLTQKIDGLALGEKEKQQERDKLTVITQRIAYAEALQRLQPTAPRYDTRLDEIAAAEAAALSQAESAEQRMQAEIHGAFAREAYLGSNEARDLRTSELGRVRDLQRELRSVSPSLRPADAQREQIQEWGRRLKEDLAAIEKTLTPLAVPLPDFAAMRAKIDASVAEQIAALNPLTQALNTAFSAVGSTLESSIIRMLDDAIATAKNFGDVMKQLALDLVKSFGASLVQSAFKPVQEALGDLAKGLQGTESGGSWWSGLLKAALGGLAGGAASIPGTVPTTSMIGSGTVAAGSSFPFSLPQGGGVALRSMQYGGIVRRPLVGEAGPEAVVPLTAHGVSAFTQGLWQSSGALHALAQSLPQHQMAGFRPVAAQDVPSGRHRDTRMPQHAGLTQSDVKGLEKSLLAATQTKPPIELTVVIQAPVDMSAFKTSPSEVIKIVGDDINRDGVLRRIIVKNGAR